MTCDFCANVWVWFRGKTQKSDQSRQKQKEPLSALSVILDALGLVCSCHGSFGWTFVLMWTNGLHHFLPEHPFYYPYMLAHTHFPLLKNVSVSFRVRARAVCTVTDRQSPFILIYTQPAGWTWIYRKSVTLLFMSLNPPCCCQLKEINDKDLS